MPWAFSNMAQHTGAALKRKADHKEPLTAPKRMCTDSSQKAVLTILPPCPIGAMSPNTNPSLTDRFPAQHSFWLKRMDVPMVCILVKWKSREWALVLVMKAREVIMYHRHPLRRVAIITGRCLTMLWQEIIKVLNPRELFAMADILPFVRSAIKQEEPHGQDGKTYWWAEYDLVEMFPNIPRAEVLTALRWVHDQLKQVSCIVLVRQKTPTVGDLCKSFQLRIPTDDVLKGCDTPEPCDCAHLAEKYGIPTVDGHCVTRDFEWLPRYSQGTGPQALTQNLKNALLPQWHHIRDSVHSGLRRSLRDLPILGNKDHLSLSVMAAIQGFYIYIYIYIYIYLYMVTCLQTRPERITSPMCQNNCDSSHRHG